MPNESPYQTTSSDRVSPWWPRSVLVTMVVGFLILSYVTRLAYDNAPPLPGKVIASTGTVLFTKEDIMAGQAVFLKYNLMEHGTLWGHGAYLGPDYSAAYLHQEAEWVRDALSRHHYHLPFSQLSEEQQTSLHASIAALLTQNLYDAEKDELLFPKEKEEAYDLAKAYWSHYFSSGEAPGLPSGYIKDPKELNVLTDFFSWAAWAAIARRPGTDVSYTNNFPYDPLAGNFPSSSAYLWSALSPLALLIALGLILLFFGRFEFLGWKGGASETLRPTHALHTKVGRLTPSQRASGKFFFIVALFFVLQVLAGGLIAHHRVEGDLSGWNIADWFPYNLFRTYHLQLAIFWIATAWIGGGLFLAPFLGRKEARFQSLGVNVLFTAVLFVTVGSLVGEYLSSRSLLPGDLWFWLGNQGSEYLDLGRFWQLLLLAGLALWICLIGRALAPALRRPKEKELSLVFLFAGLAIPIFYVPALFYDMHTHFTIIDNWRFWIIHLWVEGFFEVFATTLVAVMFVHLGITATASALRVIYLDALLYLGSGVVGTGHHWYFTGQTTVNMALSSCFSAMEVVPLTILTLDAWDFLRVSRLQCATCGQPIALRQKWSIYYLMSVGVWNFIGAGLFGFLINLPIVSYFEVGTNLTPNHAHGALFGVFGMLALAVTVFCFRELHDDAGWLKVEPLVKTAFVGLNVGMALMVFTDMFPAGVIQLWDSITHGYWHARELIFVRSGLFHTLEWIRVVPDLFFILVGAFPFALFVWKSRQTLRKSREKPIFSGDISMHML